MAIWPFRQRSRVRGERGKARNKLQRKSFSPGRNDNLKIDRGVLRPVPPLPDDYQGKKMADTELLLTNGRQGSRAKTASTEALQERERLPSLGKNNGQEMLRRKSSRKKKKDREAQIKAMLPSMPTRPAADSLCSGRPMKRESKKMRHGLNHHLHNPTSDISLPVAESINSSLSSVSDNQPEYVLSALEMLLPRPMIQCAFAFERTELHKRKISDRIPNLDETFKANKRIDELADDFDASELRELMERDRRWKARRLLEKKVMAEKNLAKQQANQRAAEAEAFRDGTSPPPNLERGVYGRDVLSATSGNSAVITSSKRNDFPVEDKEPKSFENYRQDFTNPASTAPAASEASEAMIGTARSEATTKPTVSQSSPAVASIVAPLTLDTSKNNPHSRKPASSKRSSGESSRSPLSQSRTSFFKRKTKHKPTSEPSFSNTSRDSMQANQPPSAGSPLMKVATSNIPKRTMSRFREDLPETPISPPDSRMHSPIIHAVPPINLEKKANSLDDPEERYGTPTSGMDTTLVSDETSASGLRTAKAPSPEPVRIMSQSLASIDSEGSWLSGRRGGSKRGSSQLAHHSLRDSASSLQKRYKESAEELDIADDEYFRRLSSGPEDQYKLDRILTGNPMPSSDEEDGGSLALNTRLPESTKWGAVARTPTVVHRHSYAKSREGLLNDMDYDSGTQQSGDTLMYLNRRSLGLADVLVDEDAEGDISPVSDEGTGNADVQSATSVDLGKKHVRHISAGSARLLDLKPRLSGDSKRMSLASGSGKG